MGGAFQRTVAFSGKEERMKKNPSKAMDRRTFLKVGGAMSLGAAATFGGPGGVSAQSVPKGTEKKTGEMIDMFPHILPAKYNQALLKKAKPCYYLEANRTRPPPNRFG